MSENVRDPRTPGPDGAPANAQEALRASIVDSADDVIVALTIDGIVTYWNRSAEAVYGRTSDEALGKPLSEVVGLDTPGDLVAALARIARGEHAKPYEMVQHRKDGQVISVSVTVSPILGDASEVVGASFIARDITERKRTQEQAAAASRYARSLIEASLDPLVTISADGKITDVNEATVRVTGVPRNRLIGTDFASYFTEPEKASEGYRRVFSEGFVADYPLILRSSDGRLTEVLYNASVYKDPQGRVLGVFAAARDITQLKKESEERSRLAAIVDSTVDAVIGKTPEGIIISWNKGAERMFGYKAEEVIGCHVSVLIPKHLQREEQEILGRVSRGERVGAYETQRVRKNGERIDVSLTISPVRDRDGRIVGAAKIARDITAQKRASQYARSLIEASLDPLVTISPEGKITDVNEATVRVTGRSRERLIGTDFSEYFTEPDKASDGYEQVFAKGRVTDYPLTIRSKDGHLTDVLYNASVYKDERGEVLGVFAAARDVTELKRASQYARSLIEASLDPLLTISADGKITDVNEATVRVTGVARNELIGTDFAGYFTEPEKAREGYRRVFSEGFVADYPLTFRSSDGRLTEVLYNASVYKDPQGRVLGVFAAARDITQLKKESEERSRLAAIVDSTVDAVIGKTPEGIIISWNKGAERMFGYKAEEVIGCHVSVLIPKHLQREEQEILSRVSRGERVGAYETQRVRKNGESFDVSLTISPVRDRDGRIMGAAKIVRDITAQKRASQYARSLIEASLDPLVTISPEGKITDVNEATIRVTGVPRDRLIGTDFSEYFTEPDKAREGYEQVFARGFVTDYPLTIRHRDGSTRDVVYNATVYRDAGGDVLGVFAAARDVTAQRRAEAEVAAQRRRELERLADLERFQKITVGRELKMIELKKEIARLRAESEELRRRFPEDLARP